MENEERSDIDSSYAIEHKLDKRLAAIDDNYLLTVANKPFSEYFGNIVIDSLKDVVCPDDAQNMIDFVNSFKGKEISAVFRFFNAKGELRYNALRLLASKESVKNKNINIEMIDTEDLLDVNSSLKDDVFKHMTMLGLTSEFTFTYNRNTDIFSMYKYNNEGRDVIFKREIDEWKWDMLMNGYIADSDKEMFVNLVGEIKGYVHTFSARIMTSMRTHSKIMENLRFVGTVHTKFNGEKIVIGRVLPEENINNNNQVEAVLNELSIDSLTHVYNKKTITDYAVNLLGRETKNKITIAILDVDHFKKVNDTFGHMYGDKVLARVGKKLKEVVGEDGEVGRIGGDEFIIVLHGVNDETTLRGILRAIRTQIKWEFLNDFDDLMVTCSIGAAFSPNNGNTYEELFRKADYCLYIAKEKGRDRYVFFRDDLHKESYEQSINQKDKNISDGREMKELRCLSEIMEYFHKDRKRAVVDMLNHMYESYKLDSINIYYGPDLKREFTIGQQLNNSNDAEYIRTDGFKTLLDGKDYAVVGFVGRQTNQAPEFGQAMRERRVFATIQCLIGSGEDIKGVLTLDRCKESSQWAEYEVECAIITASLLNILLESDLSLFEDE